MPVIKHTIPIPWKLVRARFIERPNRFLMRIEVDGRIQLAHLPDPGRLEELLLPDVELMVQYNPGPKRKTDWTVHFVRRPAVPSGWVCINTLLPNIFVGHALEARAFDFLSGWALKAREVTHGSSRFDFLLERAAKPLYLEVKSVTWCEGGVAQFPDAVTARGARHARHLGELARAGVDTMMLFVIQRDDPEIFKPMWDRDPDLGAALNEAAHAGVVIEAIALRITPGEISFQRRIPVDITPPG